MAKDVAPVRSKWRVRFILLLVLIVAAVGMRIAKPDVFAGIPLLGRESATANSAKDPSEQSPVTYVKAKKADIEAPRTATLTVKYANGKPASSATISPKDAFTYEAADSTFTWASQGGGSLVAVVSYTDDAKTKTAYFTVNGGSSGSGPTENEVTGTITKVVIAELSE